METWGQNWGSNMSIGPTWLSLSRWRLCQWLSKLCLGISVLEQTVFATDWGFFSSTVDVCLNHRQPDFFRTKFIQGSPKENERGARSMKEGITFKGLMAPSHFLTGMYKSLKERLGERSVWIREVWILSFLEQFKVDSKIHHDLQKVSPTQQRALLQSTNINMPLSLKGHSSPWRWLWSYTFHQCC